jgi:hypothetical protein
VALFARQADADFTALITPIRGATRIHPAEDVVATRYCLVDVEVGLD